MATTCTSCGCNKLSCGCKDSFLTTPPPCPTPADCPDPQPCSETFDSQCIIYTAPDIICNGDIVVAQDDTVQTALQEIVEYFCLQITVQEDLVCREDPQTLITVVPEGTVVTEALDLILAYFCQRFFFPTDILCDTDVVVTEGQNIQAGVAELANYFCQVIANLPVYDVQAGINADVSTSTVGTTTTFTIDPGGTILHRAFTDFLRPGPFTTAALAIQNADIASTKDGIRVSFIINIESDGASDMIIYKDSPTAGNELVIYNHGGLKGYAELNLILTRTFAGTSLEGHATVKNLTLAIPGAYIPVSETWPTTGTTNLYIQNTGTANQYVGQITIEQILHTR